MLGLDVLPRLDRAADDDLQCTSRLTVRQQTVKFRPAVRDDSTDIKSAEVMYSVFDDSTYLFSILQTRSGMYVLNNMEKPSTGVLVDKIVTLDDEESSQDNQARFLNSVQRQHIVVTLTSREQEILDNFSRGLCAKKVAQELSISYQTVRTHQKNIYKKLSVNTLLEAVQVFNQLKDLSPAV